MTRTWNGGFTISGARFMNRCRDSWGLPWIAAGAEGGQGIRTDFAGMLEAFIFQYTVLVGVVLRGSGWGSAGFGWNHYEGCSRSQRRGGRVLHDSS